MCPICPRFEDSKGHDFCGRCLSTSKTVYCGHAMLIALYRTKGLSDHISSFERSEIWKADISYGSQKTNFTQAETLCDIHGMKA